MEPKATAAFGDLLREHRIAAGLTQEQLAERAGLSVYGIQKLERGLTNPYRDTANRLVLALGLGANDEASLRAAVRPVRRHGSLRPESITGGAPQDAVVDSASRERPRPLRFAHPASALIGRRRELGTVLELLDSAALGEGTLALVSGEPGIGKTRLIIELATDAQTRGWRVLLGRAYESESPPFLPFVEALRGYVLTCSLGEAQALVARIPPALGRLIPEAANLADTPSGPGRSSQRRLAPQDPETERYQLFEAVCGMLFDIARSATPHGLLLTLDDIHWADASTLQLLLHLSRRLAGAPMLVVASHRNIGLEQTPPFTEFLADSDREAVVRRLLLSPLSRDDVSTLVSVLSGSSPAPSVVDAVFEQTKGNPFFAGEVVRHLKEQGRDVSDSMITAEDWGVPDGVHRIIGKRLSRLSDVARQVLQASAVLGEPFGFNAVEAILMADTARVLDALEEVLAAGLLREEGPKYVFSHALVRQTIYEALSLPRRQRLHRQAAEALERVYSHSMRLHLGEIAMHYRMAGGAGDASRALDFTRRAAEAALTMLAYEEAARHWQAALALADEADPDAGLRAQILAQLGELLFVTGLDYQKGVSYMDEALKIYGSLGAVNESARLHCQLGHALSSIPETWDIPRSFAHFRAAEHVLAHAPETVALGDLYAGLAQAAVWSVQIQDGLAWSKAAMDIAHRHSDDRLWARAAVVHGGHLCSSGQVTDGFALMEHAWSVGDRINDPISFFVTFVGSAFANWLGDPRAAQIWCERELGQRRVGQAHGQRRRFMSRLAAYYALGGQMQKARDLVAEVGPSYDALPVLFWAGDWEECETIAQEQIAAGRRSGDRAFKFEATYNLATLARARGDRPVARELLEDVIDIPLSGGELSYELAVRAALALLLCEMGEVQAADQHLARCHEITGSSDDWRGLEGWVWLGEGAAALARGRLRDGGELMQRAVDVFGRYSLPWAQAEAHYVWGRALCSAHYTERGRGHLDEAIEIYRRFGAGGPLIDRIHRELAAADTDGSIGQIDYPDGLSGREVEVLRLIVSGRTNKQISEQLCISLHTVASHVSHIFDKTGVANRAEAVSYAHRQALN